MRLRQKVFLVPFDYSSATIKAAKFAIDMVRDENTKLVFIHENSVQNAAFRPSFSPYIDLLEKAQVPYEYIERSGELVEVIVDAAAELNVDMIIMGTEIDNGIIDGSKTSKVIQKADCSVLTVPAEAQLNKIKKIAFACDFKDIKDSSVLDELWSIALKMKAELKIVFINKDKKKLTELWNEDVERTLEFYFHNIPHEYEILDGEDFVKTLKNYVSEKEIDLLSILPRNHETNYLEEGEGKLTRLLALRSQIPLLAVD